MSLSVEESQRVSDAFFMTLYGIDLYSKWKNLKSKMRFSTERDFVTWMLDYIIDREGLAVLQQQQQQQNYNANTGAAAADVPVINQEQLSGSVGREKHVHGNVIHTAAAFPNARVSVATAAVAESWQNREDNMEHAEPSTVEYAATPATAKPPQQQQQTVAKKIVLVRPDNAPSAVSKEDRTFKCAYCDYRAIKQSHLIMHYRTHTDERPYACDQCSAKFRNRSHVLRHVTSVHDKRKAHQCRHCQYTCARQTDLRRHLIHVHAYESNYRCTYCGKSFFSAQMLDKHALVHRVDVPEGSEVPGATAVTDQQQQVGGGGEEATMGVTFTEATAAHSSGQDHHLVQGVMHTVAM